MIKPEIEVTYKLYYQKTTSLLLLIKIILLIFMLFTMQYIKVLLIKFIILKEATCIQRSVYNQIIFKLVDDWLVWRQSKNLLTSNNKKSENLIFYKTSFIKRFLNLILIQSLSDSYLGLNCSLSDLYFLYHLILILFCIDFLF